MAYFKGLETLGFDRNVPWQMVPLNRAVPVELFEGKGLAVNTFASDGSPSSVASVMSEANTRFDFGSRTLMIGGLKPGTAVLTAAPAANAHGARESLDLSVLQRGTQRLKLYRVKDEGNQCERSDSSIEQLIRAATDYFLLMANVEFHRIGIIETVNLPGNNGAAFWLRPKDLQMFRDKINADSADLHMFFTWNIEIDLPELSNDSQVCGFAPKGTRLSFIEDDRKDSGVNTKRTVLHEMGHHCFLDHEKHDTDRLMYWSVKGTGSALTKDEILEINRRALKGPPDPPPADATFK